ncbi:YjcZ family sporulation protein [Mycoplasmatota bacterium]|nr:YjcZ family sporulation protein [Mycoplasmatota bacterium]
MSGGYGYCSSFILVLFILLVIIGCTCCHGGYGC